MSRENVEIVRALAEAFQRRQHERAFEFYDAEIEWDSSRAPTEAGVYYGHEGVRTYWRRWLSAWSDLHFEIEDVRDAGDDQVVLLIRKSAPMGTAQRHRDTGASVRLGVHPSRREGRPVVRLSGSAIGARSCRAAGVVLAFAHQRNP